MYAFLHKFDVKSLIKINYKIFIYINTFQISIHNSKTIIMLNIVQRIEKANISIQSKYHGSTIIFNLIIAKNQNR